MVAKCQNCAGQNKETQEEKSLAAKYQNTSYGTGRRVFTEGKTCHCTVCGEKYNG